jgi:hypothetical protein
MGIVGFNANNISAISWRSVVLVEKNTNLSQVTSKLFCNICNGNGQLWSWAYGSWIYNYVCKQWLSPLTLWVWMSLNRSVLDTTLCECVLRGNGDIKLANIAFNRSCDDYIHGYVSWFFIYIYIYIYIYIFRVYNMELSIHAEIVTDFTIRN